MNKIAAVSEFFPTAVTFDSTDMFALGQDDPYWDTVKEVVSIRVRFNMRQDTNPSHRKLLHLNS